VQPVCHGRLAAGGRAVSADSRGNALRVRRSEGRACRAACIASRNLHDRPRRGPAGRV